MVPTLADVYRARAVIRGVLHRTPILTSEALDAACGARLFCKAECLQKTGSYKVRGGLNRVANLTAEEKRRGIIAFSSGNHALGACHAARHFGVPATIVMPEQSVPFKLEAVRRYGPTVVQDGIADVPAGLARMNELQQQHGYGLVPPFEHPHIIAGQGTLGWEICEDAPDLDYLLVPCSGGGLLAGVLVAVSALSPRTKVIGVQPDGAPGIKLSFAAKQVVAAGPVQTIADALIATKPGELNMQIIWRHAHDIVTVPDALMLEAMRLAFRHLRLVLEPGGAAALAGAVRGGPWQGQRVGVVCSGGNVDPALLSRVLAEH